MSISQNFPTIRPSLNLNFARSKTLDPRITFTRSSTATYVDSDGLVKTAGVNQARFDHNPATGESLGLLIEEQRTNLVTYSEDFSHSSWDKQNGFSITSNTAIAPDGTLTADTASRVNTSTEYLYTNISHSGSFTISCWVKSVSGSSTFKMGAYNGTDGSISSPSYTATEEWQRFSFNGAVTTASDFYPCIPDVSGAQFYIWGAQVEPGSFSTSYIPTSGSAVTRSADLASISGDSFSKFYNPNGGTTYIDLISNGVNADGAAYQVYFGFNSDASNRWGISHQNESRGSYAANAVLPYVGQAGVFDVITRFSKTFVPGTRNKYTMTQPNGSDVKITATGVQGFTSGITSKTPAINQLYLGQVINDNGNLNGTIAEFRYYPEALTSDQITTLIK